MKLAPFIDHTNLKADATAKDIEKLCSEAKEYGFASVCVNSARTALAAELLKGAAPVVCTVVGFPLGAMETEAKAFEARRACECGASEIDMVINVGLLKDGLDSEVQKDIEAVVKAVPACQVKVIIEACLLTDEEKTRACRAALNAGAAFVKTSTGFSTGGATISDIRLMKAAVSDKMKIKAAGGIHTAEFAKALLEAGADRIGASKSVEIATDSD